MPDIGTKTTLISYICSYCISVLTSKYQNPLMLFFRKTFLIRHQMISRFSLRSSFSSANMWCKPFGLTIIIIQTIY